MHSRIGLARAIPTKTKTTSGFGAAADSVSLNMERLQALLNRVSVTESLINFLFKLSLIMPNKLLC